MAGLWAHPQLAARPLARGGHAGRPGADAAAAGLLGRRRPALDAVPALGQHTDAILAELGVDAAAIGALRAAEAI
jgi:itaconate CoA-transferase